jgi:hypothetical protein
MDEVQEKEVYVSGSQRKYNCFSIVLKLLRLRISKFVLIGKLVDMCKEAALFSITARIFR